MITRNLPVQLEVARRLCKLDRELEVVIAQARAELGPEIEAEVAALIDSWFSRSDP